MREPVINYTETNEDFREALTAVVREYQDKLTGEEMLGCAAQVLGLIIVMLEPNPRLTDDVVLQMILSNITLGNRVASEALVMSRPKGGA